MTLSAVLTLQVTSAVFLSNCSNVLSVSKHNHPRIADVWSPTGKLNRVNTSAENIDPLTKIGALGQIRLEGISRVGKDFCSRDHSVRIRP